MAKKYKTQKKKTLAKEIADIIFKILLIILLIIFAFIIYDKTIFQSNSLDFTSTKNHGKQSQKDVPTELQWFDDFKGIENHPEKNSKNKERMFQN